MSAPPVQADLNQSVVEKVRHITLVIHITFFGALTRGSFVDSTTDTETASPADCRDNLVFVHLCVRGTYPWLVSK
jgi:hypothetical protein